MRTLHMSLLVVPFSRVEGVALHPVQWTEASDSIADLAVAARRAPHILVARCAANCEVSSLVRACPDLARA